MKAAVLTKKGTAEQSIKILEIKKPAPKRGEILIKVECFGLNYADVMARLGLYDAAPKMPCVIGYEVVGVIEEVGEDGDVNLLGKRVVAFTRFGGYAEFAVTSTDSFAEIGDMNASEAAALAVQYVTAYYMAFEAINLQAGDKVMIHAGAGGVGTALIQLCKLKGCEVFGNAGSDLKLDYMKSQGADHFINYRKESYDKVVKQILGTKKLDVTFNPIAGSTFKKDMRLIGAAGKVILFGGSDRSGKKWGTLSTLNFVRKMGLIVPIALLMGSKSVIGVNMLNIGDQQPQILNRCMRAVVQLLKEGKIKPHVGGEFKYSEIAKAHSLLESRKSIGKIVVYW